MQTVKQINPYERIKDLIKSQPWSQCQTEVKRIYQLIKPRITEAQQDILLINIYNAISFQCADGICSFWRYMNN